MPTATLPQVWRGRSGREYLPVENTRIRHGGMATVRKVVGRGGPVGTSTVEDGVPLALKLWLETDAASLDQLQAEAKVLVEVSAHRGELPCPRLYDLIGNPLVTGIVMEWCPADLERWWREKLKEPDAFGRLMATMAEAARRVSDYHVFYAQKKGLDAAHGDLKPPNILLNADGRWLISDFGAARVKPPDENPLITSKVIGGTENFLAPEALFHAKKRFPTAMDTWSLAATVFALLKLRRMVLDNTQLPRNGTGNPKFRMQRLNDIHEVYGRDPTRFKDRELDADAFPEPLRLPEEDRRTVRDCLRGVFGGGPTDDEREQMLTSELLDVLDRAMSIDPKLRYTDARDLAAAFESLTRTYIELSAQPHNPVGHTDVLVRAREQADAKAAALLDEVQGLRERLIELNQRLQYADEKTAVGGMSMPSQTLPLPTREVPVAPPRWWSVALGISLVMHVVTLLALVALAILVILRG